MTFSLGSALARGIEHWCLLCSTFLYTSRWYHEPLYIALARVSTLRKPHGSAIERIDFKLRKIFFFFFCSRKEKFLWLFKHVNRLVIVLGKMKNCAFYNCKKMLNNVRNRRINFTSTKYSNCALIVFSLWLKKKITVFWIVIIYTLIAVYSEHLLLLFIQKRGLNKVCVWPFRVLFSLKKYVCAVYIYRIWIFASLMNYLL